MEHDISEAELDAAGERGRTMQDGTPLALRAHYDTLSRRIVIDFANGTTFMVPAELLQGLEDASSDDLAEVELSFGYLLRWDRLDVDFTIPGLVSGLFGTASYMAALAGKARSPAKAASSRENGKKGGRPRKIVA